MIETAPTARLQRLLIDPIHDVFHHAALREPAHGHSAPAECANPKHNEFARNARGFCLAASIARADAGVDLKTEFSTESVRLGAFWLSCGGEALATPRSSGYHDQV
jgi:hypothetical protein